MKPRLQFGKLAVRRIGSVVPLKTDLSGGGRTRLSFRRGRWKICVASPCGDAFVCIGLSEEMSHRAAQAWRAVLRAGPRAAAAGRNTVDTYQKEKRKHPRRHVHSHMNARAFFLPLFRSAYRHAHQ